MIPNPRVNHTRDGPRLQPTMSLALLVQVGGMPGWPTAWPSGSLIRSLVLESFVTKIGSGCKDICIVRATNLPCRLRRKKVLSDRAAKGDSGPPNLAQEIRSVIDARDEAFGVKSGPSSIEVTG